MHESNLIDSIEESEETTIFSNILDTNTNQMQKILGYKIQTLPLQRMISKQLLSQDTIPIG